MCSLLNLPHIAAACTFLSSPSFMCTYLFLQSTSRYSHLLECLYVDHIVHNDLFKFRQSFFPSASNDNTCYDKPAPVSSEYTLSFTRLHSSITLLSKVCEASYRPRKASECTLEKTSHSICPNGGVSSFLIRHQRDEHLIQ